MLKDYLIDSKRFYGIGNSQAKGARFIATTANGAHESPKQRRNTESQRKNHFIGIGALQHHESDRPIIGRWNPSSGVR